MDRKEKLEMLRKLSEKELTKKFIIPLYNSEGMGCKNVRYTHRRLEFGKDVIYYKEDEYGNRKYTGVQVKKTPITTKTIDNVLRQTTEAFGEPFKDSSDGKKKNLDRFVVLTSNEFLEEANESFRASLRGAKLDKLVTCVDGHQLVSLLEEHMPSVFWKEYEYFSIYFDAMKEDFTTIEDISAIGQKKPVNIEKIYVRLNLSEELLEGEIDEDEEWMEYEEEGVDIREEKPDQLRKIERQRIFDAERAVKMYDRIVIVGDPGSGKTTLVKYLALKSCKENLKRQERICVPVPIILRELADSGKSLRAYIDKVFGKYKFQQAKTYVEKDLKEGRCRLLLDGFDELATKESQKKIAGKINRFVKKYHKSKIVVTSRTAGYNEELKGFSKLKVMEFDEKQIKKFIENWFGERRAEKAKSIYEVVKGNERIKELAKNPLMIVIIVIIYEESMKLPQRRADLYKRCVEVLLSKWDMQRRIKNKYASDKKEYILRKLAFYGHSNNKRILTEEEVITEMIKHFPNVGLKKEDSKPFLSEIWKRSYLLKQISIKSYEFLHLSFQEYFTALELKETEDGIDRIIKYLHKPWWEEPILLYAGISRDASALIKTIEEKVQEDMFYNNLIMFGKCVADAEFTDVSLRKRIVNDIWILYRSSKYRIIRKRAINILGLIKPNEIIVQLISDLKKRESQENSDISNRARVATVLGHIGSEVAIEVLLEALEEDEAALVRGRVVSALGRIGSELAVEPIIQTMVKDCDVDVRGRAASALAHITSEEAVDSLIEALVNDDEIHVRGRAASALGRIGSEVVVEPLLEALVNDDEMHVRGTAASALGYIGDEVAVEPLLEVLADDETAHVRGRAASALGRIGSDVAVEPLLEVLIKDEAHVRGRVVSALGRIGSEVAVEPLIKAMVWDYDAQVRGKAASALGRIGSEDVVDLLLDTLARDGEARVRWYVASSLGHIGSEVAIKPLLKVLSKDDKAYVRGTAAFALGCIGNEVAVVPLLNALVKDNNAHVRGMAAYALGDIGSVKAIEELKKALKDEAILCKWKVINLVFEAIEKISKKEFATEAPCEK